LVTCSELFIIRMRSVPKALRNALTTFIWP
jgi:hypothetical protein